MGIKLSNDPAWVSFKRVAAAAESRIDIDRIEAEVATFMRERPSRKLHSYQKGIGSQNALRIMSAIEFDMQGRTRMVEISSTLRTQASLIETAINAVENHLLSKYTDSLGDKITERKQTVANLTSDEREMLARIQTCAENLTSVIKDIDQAGYAFKNIVEIVKLLHEAKRSQLV